MLSKRKVLVVGVLFLTVVFFGLLLFRQASVQAQDSIVWQSTTPLPQPLASHGAISEGNYLYVFGGYLSSSVERPVTDQTRYAFIKSDGSLGAWAPTTNLPRPLGSHSTLVYRGKVYILGGWDGYNPRKEVYSANLKRDGGVSDWQQTTSLKQGLMSYGAAAVYNGQIYVFGGWDGRENRDEVYYASIQTDGSLSSWSETTSLPLAFRYMAVVSYNNKIYLIGGLKDSEKPYKGLNTVYWTAIEPDGSLGSWQQTTSLPEPLHSSTAVVWEGKIYLMGGRHEGTVKNTVYKVLIQADGSLSEWTTESPLPIPVRASDSVLAENGTIYVLGGWEADGNPVNNVYFAEPPCPGHAPEGFLDRIDQEGEVCRAWGWAKDQDIPKAPINVHFYLDGPAGTGTFIGSALADDYREDVGSHGFHFDLPQEYRDGAPHSFYVHGINDDFSCGGNPLLQGSGMEFTCVGPTPPPPSCDPAIDREYFDKGDANCDNKTDDLDYVFWWKAFGINNGGDFEPAGGDGDTDNADYEVWLRNYRPSFVFER